MFSIKSLTNIINTNQIDELRFFLPLLVENLRFEPLPDPSPLFNALVAIAVRDVGVRYELFWALVLRAGSKSENAWRYESLKQMFIAKIVRKCGEEASEELTRAFSIYQVFRNVPQGASLEQIRQKLGEGLQPYQDGKSPCMFDPTHKVTKFHSEEAFIMGGVTLPIMCPITIECSTCPPTCKYRQAHEVKEKASKRRARGRDLSDVAHLQKITNRTGMIFKYEDVRKDYLVLTMVRLMEFLLKRGDPDESSIGEMLTLSQVDFTTYRVIPTSVKDGFVEFVDGATEIRKAGLEAEQSLLEWLVENGGADRKLEMFYKTMAFWSVATLLIGVGDRHARNMMIKRENGALFHVDFGFVLGEDPKDFYFVGPPLMRINQGMVKAMGEKKGRRWKAFVGACINFYANLRSHSETFFELCQVLVDADPPLDGVMMGESYKKKLIQGLHNRFSWKMGDEKAVSRLNAWIQESEASQLLNYTDSLYNLVSSYWQK